MRKIFLAGASSFAVIPGLAVLVTSTGAPPDKAVLFGGVLEAFGVLALLLIWTNKGRIRRLKQTTITTYTLLLGTGAFIALGAYLVLLDLCVATAPGRTPVYFPLWTTGEVAVMIDSAGSRDATLVRYGSGEVLEVIQQSAPIALSLTTVVLLFMYLVAVLALVCAFGIVAIKSGGNLLEGQHEG